MVAPCVGELVGVVGGQALDHGEEHSEDVFGNRLTVRAHRAAYARIAGQRLRCGIVVVSGGVELQQLQTGGLAQTFGGEVSHYDVRRGDLLVGRAAIIAVDKGCVRRTRLEDGFLGGVERRQDKNVHQGVSLQSGWQEERRHMRSRVLASHA